MAQATAVEQSGNPFPQWGPPERVIEPGSPRIRYGAALPFLSLESLEGFGPESLRGSDSICGLCGFTRKDQFRRAREGFGLPVWCVPAGVTGFGRTKAVGFLSQLLRWLEANNAPRFAELGVRPNRTRTVPES